MNLEQHKLQGVTREEVRESRDELTEEEKRDIEKQMLLKKKRKLSTVQNHIAEKMWKDYKGGTVNIDIDELRQQKQELEDEIEELEQTI